jgi:ATP-dependent RNA helicase RhlE
VNDKCFADLGLAEPLQRALKSRNHVTPTPIQAEAIPQLLTGKDMLGIAQTGTGKTGAFALPILHQLIDSVDMRGPRLPRALILAPTRELAIQIADEIRAYGTHLKMRTTTIFGGVNQKRQVTALTRGVDIVIATPGRLLDLMNQRKINLSRVQHLVLDEADRMLDMGFIRDIRKILEKIPADRQSLLFSATMPAEIARLSGEILDDPARVEVARQSTTIEKLNQSIHHVPQDGKKKLLETLLKDPAYSKVLVFARTKHRANRVAEQLEKAGVSSDAIHGNKSQGARQKALKRFKDGGARVLVATDIVARGIDVDGVTHVINFELPNDPESYVHRIGRTARAGAGGEAVSFCDPAERAYLRDIERLIQQRLTVIGEEPTGPIPRAPKQGRGGGGGKKFRGGGQGKSGGGHRSANGQRGSRGGDGDGQRPSRPKRNRSGNKGKSFGNRSEGNGSGGNGSGGNRRRAANSNTPHRQKRAS